MPLTVEAGFPVRLLAAMFIPFFVPVFVVILFVFLFLVVPFVFAVVMMIFFDNNPFPLDHGYLRGRCGALADMDAGVGSVDVNVHGCGGKTCGRKNKHKCNASDYFFHG
jgi:hypothetical protein